MQVCTIDAIERHDEHNMPLVILVNDESYVVIDKGKVKENERERER